MMLAQLLAGMKNENGHVLVPDFYDGIQPLSTAEKAALAQAPVNDQMLMNSFWLGHVKGNGKHLLELINEPSLNVNGFASGQIERTQRMSFRQLQRQIWTCGLWLALTGVNNSRV
jgi:hypothetical protein